MVVGIGDRPQSSVMCFSKQMVLIICYTKMILIDDENDNDSRSLV